MDAKDIDEVSNETAATLGVAPTELAALIVLKTDGTRKLLRGQGQMATNATAGEVGEPEVSVAAAPAPTALCRIITLPDGTRVKIGTC